jgi:hypothetical protein
MQELERGLKEAFRFMSSMPSVVADGSRATSGTEEVPARKSQQQMLSWLFPNPENSVRNDTTIRFGEYDVAASPLLGLSNVQIIYLRLPGSTYYGQGYSAYHEESLKMLYSAEISHITTTDGTATYTIRDLKDVIATILHERRADNIRVLNHLESLSTTEEDAQLEHADRVVSAKLVMDVVKEEEIGANVTV